MNIIINGIEYMPVNKEEGLKPVVINYTTSFEVYPTDLGKMNFDDAIKKCSELNIDNETEFLWRLPTRIELILMCLNKDVLATLKKDSYWTGTMVDTLSSFNFNTSNTFLTPVEKFNANYVRPVRSLIRQKQ
jgi:hypothetical protein